MDEGEDGQGVLRDPHVRPLGVVVLDHRALVQPPLRIPLLPLQHTPGIYCLIHKEGETGGGASDRVATGWGGGGEARGCVGLVGVGDSNPLWCSLAGSLGLTH